MEPRHVSALPVAFSDGTPQYVYACHDCESMQRNLAVAEGTSFSTWTAEGAFRTFAAL